MQIKSFTFTGKIHLVKNDHELALAVSVLKLATVLGFDTETRPSFKKGEVYSVALLQLATETDAYLIRLHSIRDFSGLQEIFENKAVVKVGVAIRDDLKQLQKIFKFTHENFVELQTLAKEKALKNLGLKGMADEVLGLTVSKGPKLTNWEAQVLSEQQLLYAATDAWIGLMLYRKLVF